MGWWIIGTDHLYARRRILRCRVEGTDIVSPFGPVSSTGPVSFISLWLVAALLQRRMPMCAAGKSLFGRGGRGRVDRDGVFTVELAGGGVAEYDLYPTALEDNTKLYLAVLRVTPATAG